MKPNALDMIDASMHTLRSLRRDTKADQKRRARAAIAATVDAWFAGLDDATYNRVVTEIAAAASEKNARLIALEYPVRSVKAKPEPDLPE